MSLEYIDKESNETLIFDVLSVWNIIRVNTKNSTYDVYITNIHDEKIYVKITWTENFTWLEWELVWWTLIKWGRLILFNSDNWLWRTSSVVSFNLFDSVNDLIYEAKNKVKNIISN